MDNDALINDYFEGSLSAAQEEDFNRLLQTNPDFAADFEFQRELQDSLKKDERRHIKEMLSDIDVAEKRPETKVIQLRPWLVAASAVFLIGISAWLFFFANTGFDSDQLYYVNFAPYENVVHPIERGAQIEDLKTRAFTAYEDADYIVALEFFKELQLQQADPYIAFYEAIVLMQLNKHQEAIPLLESYIDNDGQLQDRATWYLALAYLKQDAISESKEELEKLIKLNGFKAQAAEELLQDLD